MIRIIGYGLSIGMQIVMFVTFLYAYFINDMQVQITINKYGEANIELVMIVVIMVISIVGYYKMCRRKKDER